MLALGMSEPAAGVRPGGPRGAGQSAPGLLAVSPGEGRGSPAGCRPRALPEDGCLGRNAGRGGGEPEAPGGARCQRPALLEARYRCGFGRSSRFPPLCVQLPVMLYPASSFLCL